VDAGSVLGLSTLRSAFLVHLSTTKPREGQAGLGARIMIANVLPDLFTEPLRADDDDLDDEDDPDDEDDDDEDGDDEDEEEDSDEPETWQVGPPARLR
jgi:hypothetical protein